MGLNKGSLEVPLNLSVVRGDGLRHPLQVRVDLAPLVDISDVALPLNLHFVNFSLELGH